MKQCLKEQKTEKTGWFQPSSALGKAESKVMSSLTLLLKHNCPSQYDCYRHQLCRYSCSIFISNYYIQKCLRGSCICKAGKMLSFSKSPSVLEVVLSSNYWLDVILVQDNVNIKEPGFLINQLSVFETFL